MKQIILITISTLIVFSDLCSQSGRVGIGTEDPLARLHIKDSSVLFEGTWNTGNPSPLPIQGPGVRMMWYPDLAAFRAGRVLMNEWDSVNIGKCSFAAGFRTVASEFGSTAFGNRTQATAADATAFGYNSIASGKESIASGYGVNAESQACMAIGRFNVGGGDSSVWVDTDPVFEIGIGTGLDSAQRVNAMTIYKNGSALWQGYFNSGGGPPATGDGTRMMWFASKAAFRAGYVNWDQWDNINIGVQSVAFGRGTIAKGSMSAAFGQEARAFGTRSFATGYLSTAEGINSFASGQYANAAGDYSFSLGEFTKAQAINSVAFGRANVIQGNSTEWVDTDQIFAIGIGTPEDRANAMTIYKNAGALWEGEYVSTPTPDPPPTEGAGTRMMWYPVKAAFRAGYVQSTQWDEANIGNFSTAFGANTKASAYYSTALGRSTIASGAYGLACGHNSTASGDYSIVAGYGSIASGVASSAFGDNAMAEGNYSNATGFFTTASGQFSTAHGRSVNAESFACMAIGRYNFGGGSAISWIESDPLFEVGNGTAEVPANALTVLKNGNVGIGTHTPSSDLEVIGILKVDAIIQASDASGLYFRTAGNATALRIHDNGNVGIGTSSPGSHRLYVSSGATAPEGASGYFRNSSASGIALSVENTSWSSGDNALLVSNKGSTGAIASFDSWHGTNSWDREFKFTNDGDGRCDGSWIAGGADYAEFFDKADPAEGFEPGDVICMSPDKGYSVIKAVAGREQLLVGVYSTNPAIVGNSSAEEDPDNAVLVGMMGVVPTKVSTENGPIAIGDFLALSTHDGVAAIATRSGMVIGQAMEPYDGSSHGIIKVMVEPEWVQLENPNRIQQLESEVARMQARLDLLLQQFENPVHTNTQLNNNP